MYFFLVFESLLCINRVWKKFDLRKTIFVCLAQVWWLLCKPIKWFISQLSSVHLLELGKHIKNLRTSMLSYVYLICDTIIEETSANIPDKGLRRLWVAPAALPLLSWAILAILSLLSLVEIKVYAMVRIICDVTTLILIFVKTT